MYAKILNKKIGSLVKARSKARSKPGQSPVKPVCMFLKSHNCLVKGINDIKCSFNIFYC
jgi:hypothetical protein